ncbi:hypothetical protein Efla_000253 [Eimeria flavescens]
MASCSLWVKFLKAVLFLVCVSDWQALILEGAVLPSSICATIHPNFGVTLRRIPLAAVLPSSPLATDDAAAVSAVATSLQWSYRKQQPAGVASVDGHHRKDHKQMQIVGLLPATAGGQSLGGEWAPIEWHGRPLPASKKSAPFGVRLLQPNIYGVYSYLVERRQVELWKQEKTLKDGRTVVIYELRPKAQSLEVRSCLQCTHSANRCGLSLLSPCRDPAVAAQQPVRSAFSVVSSDIDTGLPTPASFKQQMPRNRLTEG